MILKSNIQVSVFTGFVVQGYRGHKNAGRKEMEFFCDQFWFCNAIPPEWHWVMPLGMPLLLIIIVAVPVANILHRAGRSRWWTILAFVPLANLIGLWVFAFTRWPNRTLAVGQRV
jgi:hypothetical protein